MNPVTFRVGVVLSPRAWPSQLHSFVADHVPEIELIVVRDQRAAREADVDVLVVDDTTPWLSQAFVTSIEADGVRIVGVYDRTDDGEGRQRLAELGLTHLMEASMPPDDAVFLLERLRPTNRPDRTVAFPSSDESGESSLGDVVAVGGPSGSGARELAVALAAEWGKRGERTLLVDLNETTPGVARRLGLGLYPHVLTAAERVREHGYAAVVAALADRPPDLPFDVIVGIPSPRDWDRLMANDLDALLAAMRAGWDRIVVTTSPIIEDLQRWVDRFGTSRNVLANANVVIGCCEPSPRGVLRFLDWAADVRDLRDEVTVVVNKVPKSRWIAAEVLGQLADAGGALLSDPLQVPFDRAVSTAEWDGRLVGRGPFTKAVARVVDQLEGDVARHHAAVVG